MSHSTLSKYPPARDQDPEPDDAEYEEPYDEGYEQPAGLFSSPGRTIVLATSMLLLVLVAVVIAWKLGEMARPGSATASASQDSSKLAIGPKTGLLAPDFSLVDVQTNKTVTLSSLRGEPVWINFWGTWCPPCRAEMPEMEKLYGSVKDKVHILGISMGPRDEPAGVAQFVKLNNYSWEFIHDSDGSVMTRYQVTGIPSSFFIDKNGVIRAVHVGGAAAPELQANLKLAMDQQ